jgi:FkbM family methyltransferase
MIKPSAHLSDPVFGTYALPAKREALRKRADRYGDTKIGKWAISLTRKRALKNLDDPFDIEVIDGVRARLWPRTSRCEKRVFAGQQIWDSVERNALLNALDKTSRAPFIFLDVGANVGLYSLIFAAHANSTNKQTRIFAVEPDTTNRARLEFNIKASDADITVLPFAISDKAGKGQMAGGGENRGEAQLSENAGGENAVKIQTLHGICKTNKLPHIDAMKVDIEGHDLRALTAFFDKAPKKLWPSLLILETGRNAMTPILELCASHGYTITKRAGINTVLTRQE